MKFTVLGSGTGVASPRRGAAGYVLQEGTDTILFDCGMGTLQRLLAVGIDPVSVTHVFLSHHHPDHCADTVGLIFAHALGSERRPPGPLRIYGPTGTADFVKALYAAFPGLEPLDNFIEVEEAMYLSVPGDDWKVTSGPVVHAAVHAVGFRIEIDGQKIVYSGDTGECDGIATLATGADIFLSECSYPDGTVSRSHLTPSAVGRIATRAGAKRVVLSHLYPQTELVDVVSQCSQTFCGPVTLARDLMAL